MFNIALRLSNTITREASIAHRPRMRQLLPQLPILTSMRNIVLHPRLITTRTHSIAHRNLHHTPISNIAHQQRVITTLTLSIAHRL